MTDLDSAAVIELLGLRPHPEGGWFAETHRDAACTAIYFLLRTGERSNWHRVHGSAEVWHHYAGDPLTVSISANGTAVESVILGTDLASNQRPQAIVPPGAWQSADPMTGEYGFVLAGCTVSPPFLFDAFEPAPPGWRPGG